MHVTEGTHMLFCAMEEEVCRRFTLAKATQASGNREHREESVLENE